MNGLYKIDWSKVLYYYMICGALIYGTVIVVLEVQAQPKTFMDALSITIEVDQSGMTSTIKSQIPASVQYFGYGAISLILVDYRSKYERLPKS